MSSKTPKNPRPDENPVVPLTEQEIRELRAEVMKADELIKRILADQKIKNEEKAGDGK